MVAHEIASLVQKALTLIEDAIKEDPQHIDWYMSIKYSLESADSDAVFCIED